MKGNVMLDSELLHISQRIVKFVHEGRPAKDVIEQTAYTENEVFYQLAKFFVANVSIGKKLGSG